MVLSKSKVRCNQHRHTEMDCPFSFGFYKMHLSIMCHIDIVS